jgi:hypothetical protein
VQSQQGPSQECSTGLDFRGATLRSGGSTASLEFQRIEIRYSVEVVGRFSILLSHKDTLSVAGSKRSFTLTFVRLATTMLFVNTRVGSVKSAITRRFQLALTSFAAPLNM